MGYALLPAPHLKEWMVLIQKLGIGISVQLLGVLLSLSGYRSTNDCKGLLQCLDQPDSAQVTIRLCMGLIPAFLVGLGMLIMRRWPAKGNQINMHLS